MSCTVMYQPYKPYAMSYSSSSCDRTSSSDKKLFKLTQAPSPPDSLASETSSYNSPGPGPMSVGTTPSSHSSAASNSQSSRRPLTPAAIITSRSSSASAAAGGPRSTSLSESQAQHEESPSTSHHHHNPSHHSHSTHLSHPTPGPSTSSHRAHYLNANCVVFVHYNGDVSRVVDEHFSRALSAAYATDKPSKGSPMSQRNFPPSFWNSNYQPSKPLASYGATAADFYGAAVEYGTGIPSLAHHHQPDPWHYPLPPPHQSYHRPTEIPYPPMPSSSRFNAAAQYGSFLLAGAAASSSSGRFPVLPGSSQCNVKGDTGGWGGGRYHHHHDSLTDLHLADYSAAAAAHYSNMTAGLESSVQDSSKDLYWF